MNMSWNLVSVVLVTAPLVLVAGCVDNRSLGASEGHDGADTETSGASGATRGDAMTATDGADTSPATSGSQCGAIDCRCPQECEPKPSCDEGFPVCTCECREPGDPTDGATDGTTGVVPEVCRNTQITAASQLAYRYADLPKGGGNGGGSASTGSDTTGGGGVDPDTLFVELGTEPLACGESPTYACGNWRVTIGIPPELQAPGVYDIEDSGITLSYTVQDEPYGNDPEDCSFGGGGAFGGTLEIFSIDDDVVHGALCSADLFDVEADGVFAAMRC